MEADAFEHALQEYNCTLIGTESKVIFSVTGCSCALSIIGAIVILYSYARLSSIRDDTRLLLVFLTIADLLTASGIIMIPCLHFIYITLHDYEKIRLHFRKVCKVQSFISTFSGLASFFWTFVIAVYITSCRRLNRRNRQRRFVFVLAFLLCWGIPGVVVGLALKSDVLGVNLETTGPWCWIRGDIDEKTKVTWMLLAGKGWECLCYFASANLYILPKVHAFVRKKCRHNYRQLRSLTAYQSVHENNHDRLDDSDHRNSLLYLLMALYLLRIWGTSRFVINVLSKHMDWHLGCTVRYILLILQSYGDSGQGFWNFVIFCCMDKAVKFRELCCCSVSREDNNQRDRERQPLVREMVESSSRRIA